MPETSTESPATAVVDPNTNRPSLVAGLASGAGSWIQKPLPRLPVTMPGTFVTASPSLGDTKPPPWMSWMRSGPGSPVPVPSPPGLAAPGVGAPAAKSVALLSVSAAADRCTENVLDAPVTGALSLITAVP